MGRGGAQLGKAVKGKSKERKKEPPAAGASGEASATDKAIHNDIKTLEDYEKRNELAEIQRARLKKLHQQEEYSGLNKKLIKNIHRRFMRADKVTALRRECEILAQNHERDVDRKNALIQMHLADQDDAEEQMRTAQRSHLQKLEILLELHLQKVNQIEAEFERDVKTIKNEFETERREVITQKHNRKVREMKGIIDAVEAENQERIADAKQQHETEREEIRNKNLESINELRINLENKIEDLEKQFDEAHQNYVEGTDVANRNFRTLQKEDKRLSRRIDRKKKKIERFQASLVYWKKKIESNAKECRARNEALMEQRKAVLMHCVALKKRMQRFRASESKKITELALISRQALKVNEEKLHKATKIIQLAELARKYETEREKVLPFYKSTVRPEDETAVLAQMELSTKPSVHAQALDAHGNAVEKWATLDNFFKKYNKVLLDKLAIEQEKQRLQKENMDLRTVLKQYLDGIAVTADSVDAPNSLLIVNGRVNILGGLGGPQGPQGRVRQAPPKVITEANTTVTNYARQSRPWG